MNSTPLSRAGIVLGLGFGGFFDGIVLHQILGWHHLVCTTATCQPHTVDELKRQNTHDGFFHLAVWILTLIGILMLFRAAHQQAQRWSGRALTEAILTGWGVQLRGGRHRPSDCWHPPRSARPLQRVPL